MVLFPFCTQRVKCPPYFDVYLLLPSPSGYPEGVGGNQPACIWSRDRSHGEEADKMLVQEHYTCEELSGCHRVPEVLALLDWGIGSLESQATRALSCPREKPKLTESF